MCLFSYIYIYIHIATYMYVYIYIYIYIYMADSQISYSEMVAERKTEESIPNDSKKQNIRVQSKKAYPFTCVSSGYVFLTRQGMLTPLLQGYLNQIICLKNNAYIHTMEYIQFDTC